MANLNDLILTDELQEKLQKAENLEEVAQICAAEGVSVTADELAAALAEPSGDKNGELSEDALEGVSGGASFVNIISFIRNTWRNKILTVSKKRK